MNKRLFALLSVLVLASLMFTACGTPSAPVQIDQAAINAACKDHAGKVVPLRNLKIQCEATAPAATEAPTKVASATPITPSPLPSATFTPSMMNPVPTTGTVWYSNSATPSMTPKPSATYISPTPSVTPSPTPAEWVTWAFDNGALTCEKKQEGINVTLSGKGVTDAYCTESNRSSFAIRVGKDEFTFMMARDKSGSTTVVFDKNHPELCVFSQKNHTNWTFDSKQIEQSVLDANDPIKISDASNATINMRCVADNFDVSVEAYIKK